MSDTDPRRIADLERGHYGYRYHVPLTHERGAPPPPILLTVDGMTEEVADYMGRHYLCEMATLGSRLETCPGRLGRLARWIVRRARFEPESEAEAKWRALSPDERRRRAQRHIDGSSCPRCGGRGQVYYPGDHIVDCELCTARNDGDPRG